MLHHVASPRFTAVSLPGVTWDGNTCNPQLHVTWELYFEMVGRLPLVHATWHCCALAPTSVPQAVGDSSGDSSGCCFTTLAAG
jgi:hypothetical protein